MKKIICHNCGSIMVYIEEDDYYLCKICGNSTNKKLNGKVDYIG